MTQNFRLEHISKATISWVIPAFDEADVLPEFHRRAAEVANRLSYLSEFIYVNDGSKDGTLSVLRTIAASDDRVRVVDLSRNFGKEAAMTAGLDHAEGDAVIIIDADLQDPPELVPDLLREWERGHEVVYAKRVVRDGESAIKRLTAHIFYRLIRRVNRVQIPEDTGDYRVLDRRAVEALSKLKENHRFMKGLFAWIGFSQKAVEYRRDPRYAGSSKFNYWKLWNFALEGFTSFTIAPLKVSMYAGVSIAALALAYAAFIVVRTLFHGDPVTGYPSLVTIMLLLGGVQLFSIGVLGEYVGRMFNETKQRPLYLVRSATPPVLDDAAHAAPGGPEGWNARQKAVERTRPPLAGVSWLREPGPGQEPAIAEAPYRVAVGDEV